ncbi:MAG: hypothetical protein L6Q66_05605, partial [Bacteroidia bacterium]|nr:hypothetical protein [Bacteroidia bacterium]
MKNKKLLFFTSLLTLLLLKPEFLFSQQLNYTLSRDFLWGIDASLNSKEQNIQTFIKPYTFETVKSIKDSAAVFPRLLAGTKAEERDKKAKSQVEIYPLLNASAGYEAGSTNRFSNDLAIGAHLLGYIGNKFAFNFKALGGKAVFNSFTDSIVSETNVNPGIGYVYRSNNDSLNQQYAYQYFSGYITYAPNKIFNIQLGQDKHFWGDGYRSLFLSDNAS